MGKEPLLNAASRGFTIVEIMVGLVLGMIGIIIMYQVFEVFEGQRRTTVSGGNAQTAGHISMYGVERDLKLAGLGLFHVQMSSGGVADYEGEYACPGGIRTYGTSGLAWTGPTAGPALPVRIADGGAGSDDFTITYAESAQAGTAARVVGAGATTLAQLVNTGLAVDNVPFLKPAPDASNPVLNKDDFIILARPSGTSFRCLRLKITGINRTTANPNYLELTFLPGNKPGGTEENPPDSVADFFPAGGAYTAAAQSYIKPAGLQLNWVRYRVDSAAMQLIVESRDQAPRPVAEGVVSLQVQYGIGPKANDVVDGIPCQPGFAHPVCQRVIRWVDAVNGMGFDGVNWGAPTSDQDIRRIKAVRVAIVMRSENLERDTNPLAVGQGLYGAAGSGKPIEVVPGACTSAAQVTDAALGLLCAWADGVNAIDASVASAPRVDLTRRPDGVTAQPDWDRYRYRVYETTVPMRNVMWSTKGS